MNLYFNNYFSTNNPSPWNWERGPRTFGPDKRSLFPSINEIQLVYSCATSLTVSQVTKQNETFRGHCYDVKEFWASLGTLRWPTTCFLDSIFPPIHHCTACSSERQISTVNLHTLSSTFQTSIIYFYPSVCFCFCFSYLKKKNLSSYELRGFGFFRFFFFWWNFLPLWFTALGISLVW